MAEGLIIEDAGTPGLAMVMARKGITAAQIGTRLGLDLRDGPAASGGATLMLLGMGPGNWLARTETPAANWAENLAATLAGLASVSEVSDGYRLFRLSGPGARTLLQRGAFIDFHPARFAPGSVATTVIAHIGTIIRQVDDHPTYEVAVFRSLADSFSHWLAATTASL